jgi:MoaA/NifB/PqqE/SkfB family radical SAM enzyme
MLKEKNIYTNINVKIEESNEYKFKEINKFFKEKFVDF